MVMQSKPEPNQLLGRDGSHARRESGVTFAEGISDDSGKALARRNRDR